MFPQAIYQQKFKLVVYKKNRIEQDLIRKILEQGIADNIFEIDDIQRTTLAVHTSLHIFQLPLAMTVHSFDALQEMATATSDLILNGLLIKN